MLQPLLSFCFSIPSPPKQGSQSSDDYIAVHVYLDITSYSSKKLLSLPLKTHCFVIFFINTLISLSQELYKNFLSQMLWNRFHQDRDFVSVDVVNISCMNNWIFMGDDRHGGVRDLSETTFRLSQSCCRPEGHQKRSDRGEKFLGYFSLRTSVVQQPETFVQNSNWINGNAYGAL